jgi:hypothetical protein
MFFLSVSLSVTKSFAHFSKMADHRDLKLLWLQFCALLLKFCKELVSRVNLRRSESICRLKRTPLPVLAYTRYPDKTNARCAENMMKQIYTENNGDVTITGEIHMVTTH